MDANQSIEEDDSKLVIRHEFGHILGFPDCYHEFYDTELDGFVNYQLDTTDIMCSGTGAMTERMYKELKRVYFK
jgi:bacillopeptidase F (M6 metalloprotease family)